LDGIQEDITDRRSWLARRRCKITTGTFQHTPRAAIIFKKLELSQRNAAADGSTLNRRTKNFPITMETT
jgi:hypothetical protein